MNATEDVVFTVNYRTDIDTDMLVEYAGEYYQITRIDNHEGYKTDIDLYCKTNPEQQPDITERQQEGEKWTKTEAMKSLQ